MFNKETSTAAELHGEGRKPIEEEEEDIMTTCLLCFDYLAMVFLSMVKSDDGNFYF